MNCTKTEEEEKKMSKLTVNYQLLSCINYRKGQTTQKIEEKKKQEL